MATTIRGTGFPSCPETLRRAAGHAAVVAPGPSIKPPPRSATLVAATLSPARVWRACHPENDIHG